MIDITGKELIAYRTAQFFKDGDVVNLGIGMPVKCLNYLPENADIWIDTENGAVGLAGAPGPDDLHDPNVVDAGGNHSTLKTGASCFDSFHSFGYIRGGHIDITVLGAYEVDSEGSLANWKVPGKAAAGMGGAMDLVSGSKTTIVMSTHCDKYGNPKLVEHTDMPLTGWRCVDYFVSELAVIGFEKDENGVPYPVLLEISRSTTLKEVIEKTAARLKLADRIGIMEECCGFAG